MIYEYLYDELSADSTLMAIGDIYPDIIPQNVAYPAMLFKVISAVPEITKEGVSVVDVIRVRFYFVGSSSVIVGTMADRVRTLLEGKRDTTNNIDLISWADFNQDWDNDLEVHIREDDYFIRELK